MLFSGDSSVVAMRSRAHNGNFTFEGSVKGTVYAEISAMGLPQPLRFFLDPSETTISLNTSSPQKSAVTGSRTNSLYRIALEQIGEGDANALAKAVVDVRTEVFAPYILYSNSSLLAPQQLLSLFDTLSGQALTAFHYRVLKQHLSALKATTVGQSMPDFLFPDEKGHIVHFDTICSKAEPKKELLLVLGASWCEQCNRIAKSIDTAQYNLLYIKIDHDSRGWDAPFMRQLAVDHIPYLILLDKDGRIKARDIRIWQLKNL